MQNENTEVLKKVAELLLDESVNAKIETTYLRDNQAENGVEYTTQPGIPTELGKVNFWANMSENAHRARSVKIGNYSIRKFGERGFRIITPEGKDYFFEGSLSNNVTAAAYIWAAALAKCDNKQNTVNLYLNHVKSLGDLTAPQKTQKKSKYEVAKEQILSLGVPENELKFLKQESGLEM